MENPLFPNKIDRSTAVGAVKRTGSMDADILASVRASLVQTSRTAVRGGWSLIVCGALICLTIIGIPAGITMALLGWWVIARANKNIRLVDEVLTEFTAEPAFA